MAKSFRAALVPALVLVSAVASAQPVDLAFDLPTDEIHPGDPVWVDLEIDNSGPPLSEIQLFVAMGIGTGDYWFWPGWVHYPPDLDWLATDVATGGAEQEILPEFAWPAGCGSGSAGLVSAVLHDGVLVSNVAMASFSWLEGATSGFVLVPAGSFTMGSPPDEMCRVDDETQHHVTLMRSFYMQQTEVTQAQWVAIFGTNPSYFTGDLNRPVEQVTWFDCVIYCNRISQAAGLRRAYYSDSDFTTPFEGTPPVLGDTVYWDQTAAGYRLPTESEWEYACRAGTTTAYNSGQLNTSCYDDPNLDALAWYYYNTFYTTHAVGGKQANSWALYDMLGNVWEWCWDWYGTYPGTVTDPTGPSTGSGRMYRGGSWYGSAGYCRSAIRYYGDSGGRYGILGFRPVRTAP